MSSVIADWKDNARDRVLWIDFERYAWRVFAGSAEDWYHNSVRFAGTLNQALRVIRSDVVAIDLLAPFIAACNSNASDEVSQPSRLIDFLSQRPEPLAFVSDVADALKYSIGGRADLVLKLCSPRDLLLAVGASDEIASDFAVLDDLSTALVGLVRRLSNKAFTCLQLSSRAPAGLSADEQEAYAPILKTAEYYGWATCISYENCSTGALSLCEFDFALFPEITVEELAARGDKRCGGGLTPRFWRSPGELLATDAQLLHGTIPEDAHPETVSEKIKALAR